MTHFAVLKLMENVSEDYSTFTQQKNFVLTTLVSPCNPSKNLLITPCMYIFSLLIFAFHL